MAGHMIHYRYSLKVDLRQAYRTIKNYRWLKKNRLIFFLPTPLRLIHILLKKPTPPQLEMRREIECYWVSSGTWGAYDLPDRIYLCPWNIDQSNGGIAGVIKHEIVHLEHEQTVRDMDYKNKENFITNHGG